MDPEHYLSSHHQNHHYCLFCHANKMVTSFSTWEELNAHTIMYHENLYDDLNTMIAQQALTDATIDKIYRVSPLRYPYYNCHQSSSNTKEVQALRQIRRSSKEVASTTVYAHKKSVIKHGKQYYTQHENNQAYDTEYSTPNATHDKALISYQNYLNNRFVDTNSQFKDIETETRNPVAEIIVTAKIPPNVDVRNFAQNGQHNTTPINPTFFNTGHYNVQIKAKDNLVKIPNTQQNIASTIPPNTGNVTKNRQNNTAPMCHANNYNTSFYNSQKNEEDNQIKQQIAHKNVAATIPPNTDILNATRNDQHYKAHMCYANYNNTSIYNAQKNEKDNQVKQHYKQKSVTDTIPPNTDTRNSLHNTGPVISPCYLNIGFYNTQTKENDNQVKQPNAQKKIASTTSPDTDTQKSLHNTAPVINQCFFNTQTKENDNQVKQPNAQKNVATTATPNVTQNDHHDHHDTPMISENYIQNCRHLLNSLNTNFNTINAKKQTKRKENKIEHQNAQKNVAATTKSSLDNQNVTQNSRNDTTPPPTNSNFNHTNAQVKENLMKHLNAQNNLAETKPQSTHNQNFFQHGIAFNNVKPKIKERANKTKQPKPRGRKNTAATKSPTTHNNPHDRRSEQHVTTPLVYHDPLHTVLSNIAQSKEKYNQVRHLNEQNSFAATLSSIHNNTQISQNYANPTNIKDNQIGQSKAQTVVSFARFNNYTSPLKSNKRPEEKSSITSPNMQMHRSQVESALTKIAATPSSTDIHNHTQNSQNYAKPTNIKNNQIGQSQAQTIESSARFSTYTSPLKSNNRPEEKSSITRPNMQMHRSQTESAPTKIPATPSSTDIHNHTQISQNYAKLTNIKDNHIGQSKAQTVVSSARFSTYTSPLKLNNRSEEKSSLTRPNMQMHRSQAESSPTKISDEATTIIFEYGSELQKLLTCKQEYNKEPKVKTQQVNTQIDRQTNIEENYEPIQPILARDNDNPKEHDFISLDISAEKRTEDMQQNNIKIPQRSDVIKVEKVNVHNVTGYSTLHSLEGNNDRNKNYRQHIDSPKVNGTNNKDTNNTVSENILYCEVTNNLPKIRPGKESLNKKDNSNDFNATDNNELVGKENKLKRKSENKEQSIQNKFSKENRCHKIVKKKSSHDVASDNHNDKHVTRSEKRHHKSSDENSSSNSPDAKYFELFKKFIDYYKFLSEPKEKLFKCTKCSIHFSKKCKLRTHLHKYDHDCKKWTCNICGFKFSKSAFKKHNAKHHSKEYYDIVTVLSSSDSSSDSSENEDETLKTSTSSNSESETLNTSNIEIIDKTIHDINLNTTLADSDTSYNEESSKSHNLQSRKYKYSTFYANEYLSNEYLEPVIPDITITLRSDEEQKLKTPVFSKDQNEKSDEIPVATKTQTQNTKMSKEMRKNVYNSYSRTIYMCAICNVCFATKSTIRNHIYQTKLNKTNYIKINKIHTHHIPRAKICSMCHLTFSSIITLKRHRTYHHDFKKIRTKSDLTIIILPENSKTTYADKRRSIRLKMLRLAKNIAIKRRIRKEKLRLQMKRLNRNNSVLEMTEKNTSDENQSRPKDELKRLKIMLYKCKSCDVHFITKDDFLIHLEENKHDVKDRYRCPQCSYEFCDKEYLRLHMEIQHAPFEMDAANFIIVESLQEGNSIQKNNNVLAYDLNKMLLKGCVLQLTDLQSTLVSTTSNEENVSDDCTIRELKEPQVVNFELKAEPSEQIDYEGTPVTTNENIKNDDDCDKNQANDKTNAKYHSNEKKSFKEEDQSLNTCYKLQAKNSSDYVTYMAIDDHVANTNLQFCDEPRVENLVANGIPITFNDVDDNACDENLVNDESDAKCRSNEENYVETGDQNSNACSILQVKNISYDKTCMGIIDDHEVNTKLQHRDVSSVKNLMVNSIQSETNNLEAGDGLDTPGKAFTDETNENEDLFETEHSLRNNYTNTDSKTKDSDETIANYVGESSEFSSEISDRKDNRHTQSSIKILSDVVIKMPSEIEEIQQKVDAIVRDNVIKLSSEKDAACVSSTIKDLPDMKKTLPSGDVKERKVSENGNNPCLLSQIRKSNSSSKMQNTIHESATNILIQGIEIIIFDPDDCVKQSDTDFVSVNEKNALSRDSKDDTGSSEKNTTLNKSMSRSTENLLQLLSSDIPDTTNPDAEGNPNYADTTAKSEDLQFSSRVIENSRMNIAKNQSYICDSTEIINIDNEPDISYESSKNLTNHEAFNTNSHLTSSVKKQDVISSSSNINQEQVNTSDNQEIIIIEDDSELGPIHVENSSTGVAHDNNMENISTDTTITVDILNKKSEDVNKDQAGADIPTKKNSDISSYSLKNIENNLNKETNDILENQEIFILDGDEATEKGKNSDNKSSSIAKNQDTVTINHKIPSAKEPVQDMNSNFIEIESDDTENNTDNFRPKRNRKLLNFKFPEKSFVNPKLCVNLDTSDEDLNVFDDEEDNARVINHHKEKPTVDNKVFDTYIVNFLSNIKEEPKVEASTSVGPSSNTYSLDDIIEICSDQE